LCSADKNLPRLFGFKKLMFVYHIRSFRVGGDRPAKSSSAIITNVDDLSDNDGNKRAAQNFSVRFCSLTCSIEVDTATLARLYGLKMASDAV
jgi:hypothetical protein